MIRDSNGKCATIEDVSWKILNFYKRADFNFYDNYFVLSRLFFLQAFFLCWLH